MLTSISLLLANGADVEAKNKEGKTPLMVAESVRAFPAAAQLIQNGAAPTGDPKRFDFSTGATNPNGIQAVSPSDSDPGACTQQ